MTIHEPNSDFEKKKKKNSNPFLTHLSLPQSYPIEGKEDSQTINLIVIFKSIMAP